MEYIGETPQPGCLFCRVRGATESQDAANLVLRREPDALVTLNRFPYNPGHVMVAPRLHTGSLTGLDDAATLALFRLVRRSLEVLEAELHPAGFNTGVNLGGVAGAGIPGHVHVHIVPRWAGDTNFMPVLADTKVIPEHLERTRAKLAPAFA
ncbi:MAG: HIT domain-containing protein [Candidatus Dormibacteraeota bacterium]|nr:HIT domain-containing protein [Candidatus Dormibacteraeota bacterium]